jgi:hypothetical protein
MSRLRTMSTSIQILIEFHLDEDSESRFPLTRFIHKFILNTKLINAQLNIMITDTEYNKYVTIH